jgi:hypothetical protein
VRERRALLFCNFLTLPPLPLWCKKISSIVLGSARRIFLVRGVGVCGNLRQRKGELQSHETRLHGGEEKGEESNGASVAAALLPCRFLATASESQRPASHFRPFCSPSHAKVALCSFGISSSSHSAPLASLPAACSSARFLCFRVKWSGVSRP